jgi:hypothetical protein
MLEPNLKATQLSATVSPIPIARISISIINADHGSHEKEREETRNDPKNGQKSLFFL